MTSLESITVSLEWAKKLKEARWPQDDSVLCIYETPEGDSVGWGSATEQAIYGGDPVPTFSAPTAEEILRRLPKSVATRDHKIHRLSINCNGGKRWQMFYGKDFWDGIIRIEPDESIANAAAAMYCYLAEKKLLPSRS